MPEETGQPTAKLWWQSRGVTGSMATILTAGLIFVSTLIGHYQGKGQLPPMTYDTGVQAYQMTQENKDDTEQLLVSLMGVFAGFRALAGRISASSQVKFLHPPAPPTT